MLQEVPTETLGVVPVPIELGEMLEAGTRIAGENGVGHGEHESPVGRTQERPHRRLVQATAVGREHLVEQRLRIAQAALGLARDEGARRVRQRRSLGRATSRRCAVSSRTRCAGGRTAGSGR